MTLSWRRERCAVIYFVYPGDGTAAPVRLIPATHLDPYADNFVFPIDCETNSVAPDHSAVYAELEQLFVRVLDALHAS